MVIPACLHLTPERVDEGEAGVALPHANSCGQQYPGASPPEFSNKEYQHGHAYIIQYFL